jgi:hypothetical protein
VMLSVSITVNVYFAPTLSNRSLLMFLYVMVNVFLPIPVSTMPTGLDFVMLFLGSVKVSPMFSVP